MFSVILGSLVVVIAIMQILTPKFQAQTLLLMEPQQVTIPTVDSFLAGRTADDQGVRSQVEVLRSRGLAAATIKLLQLEQDPEFNNRLRPPGLTDKLLAILLPGETEAAGGNQSSIVDAFLNRLDVEAVKNSRVLSVVFTSVEAEKTALISNTLADQYLVAELETKFEATKVANSWLNERVSGLRDQVAASEKAVEDFRGSAELLQTQGDTLIAQQMAELNGQLIMARTIEAESRARFGQLSSLVNSPDGVSTASEVLDSPIILRLKDQQTQVERRVAELSAEYGPSHPRMIQLQAEAEDVVAKIDVEVNKIVRNLSNEVAIASAREAALDRELGRLKDVMAQSNDKQIQLRALEREAEANRALLATLLARFKEISYQDGMQPQQAGARVISRADTPSKPSFPNKPFMLGIVIPLSALLALIAVFVLESLQRGFTSGDQIEDDTGVTSLGFVPFLGRQSGKKVNPVDYILERPRSAISQALRTAYWSLSISVPSELKTVVVTSSHPGEGKTTIALGLARTQAVSGRKTLLIDADTRNPAVHKALGVSVGPGLTEILDDSTDEANVLTDNHSGLDFITAGAPAHDPLPLLDSAAMDILLEKMTERYDLVVIDTPPVMAGLDACALSRKTDTTLLIVRWSKTPRAVVKHSLRELGRTSGRLVGAILNMVDVGKLAMYHYGDAGAYYGRLQKYYSESE